MLAAVAVTAAVTVTTRPERPAPTDRATPEPVRQQAPPPPARASGQPGRTVPVDAPNGQVGVPDIALRAYRAAEQRTAVSRPGCHLSWSLVAAIGRVESNHARGGDVDGGGTTTSPIIGPQLNGNGYASISDTDNGVLDGDTDWDRAVGPMQFIPGTWRRNGVDGNADGVASPHNLFDAAGAAGRYLCAGGRDLSDPAQLAAAVFSYNPSQSYVEIVLSWQRAYASGITVLPPVTQPMTQPVPPALAPAPGAEELPRLDFSR
jgi:membrane-bound lytic murein transglycosylase B